MKVCSIDPGAEGYACFWDTIAQTVYPKRLVWKNGILRMNLDADLVVIEKLGQLPPKMAKKTVFAMGSNYGQILAAIKDIPTQFVLSKAWQKVCFEGTSAKSETKLRSVESFVKLNPEFHNCKINHNLSDAYNIGRYWLMKTGMFGMYTWESHEGISPK